MPSKNAAYSLHSACHEHRSTLAHDGDQDLTGYVL